MFKYILCFTFAVSLASAATISTTATCDGVTTFGTTDASCVTADVFAQANVGQIMVAVVAGGTSPPFGPGSASASFSADEVLTVNGGTGGAFFFPCFTGGGNGNTMVSMSFAGVGFSPGDTGGGPTGNCLGPNFLPPPQPFTFGVPQIVHISNTGFASSELNNRDFSASAMFDRIEFRDASGNLLPNATFTLVEAPEPSSWSLLAVGLMFFVVSARRCIHLAASRKATHR